MHRMRVIPFESRGVGKFHRAAELVTFAARRNVQPDPRLLHFLDFVFQLPNFRDAVILLLRRHAVLESKRKHMDVHSWVLAGSSLPAFWCPLSHEKSPAQFLETTRRLSTAIHPSIGRATFLLDSAERKEQHSNDLNGPLPARPLLTVEIRSCRFAPSWLQSLCYSSH